MYFLYKYSKGIATLSSFFIASPVVKSYVPLWKRIFKTEGGFFKYIETVNVDFIDSELSDVNFHMYNLLTMIPGNYSEILHPKQQCHLPILYTLDDQFA